MRGGITVLLVFLVCLVVVVLYVVFGRAQVSRGISELRDEDAALQATLDIIRHKEEEMPELMASLPLWSKQLGMFSEAIPSKINDNVFLASLVTEFEARNIQILNLQTTIGGSWLGPIDEDMELQLESLGINVAAARGVKVAYYSATVVGDFREVLGAFENMKRHNRLFTLDFVSGPASAGAGAVAATLDQSQIPLTFSGSLYFGIDEQQISQETLSRVFTEAISSPAARTIFNGVRDAAEDVPEADVDAEASDEPAGHADAGMEIPREFALALLDCQKDGIR